MISFTSLEFIFRFFPIFLIAYYLTPVKYRNITALTGSIIFYSFGEPLYVIVLIVLALVNYWVPKGAVIIDILVLITFKIVTFPFIAELEIIPWDIHFPIGMSFYIFKLIAFGLDIRSGKIPEKPGFVNSILYFTLFPQVTEGPIMRYNDGRFAINKTFSLQRIEEGLKLFVIGLAMKVVLADRIGILWNDLGMYGYESISTPLAWIGAFAYSFELYFDFWGYSLMASGIMVMMGYKFILNFRHPYASTSISEFYRRWHISLGSFFRDYIYFPLGGSKTSRQRMIINLMVVWLITGLWHGTGINFIIWGAVLGFLIVAEKLAIGKWLKAYPLLGRICVLLIIPVTWVIFAIDSLKDLGIYLGRMFPLWHRSAEGTAVSGLEVSRYLKDYGWMFVVAIVLCIPQTTELYMKYRKKLPVTIGLIVLFWYSVYLSATSEFNPFMYLNF